MSAGVFCEMTHGESLTLGHRIKFFQGADGDHKIMEYYELEGSHRDHRVQVLAQDSNSPTVSVVRVSTCQSMLHLWAGKCSGGLNLILRIAQFEYQGNVDKLDQNQIDPQQ